MSVAVTLQDHLDSNEFEYDLVDHLPKKLNQKDPETGVITGDRVAKPVLLGDDDSYLLAVLPASHRLDLDRLNSAMARSLLIMNQNELEATFHDCARDAIPPTGDLYGVDTIVDPSLFHKEEVFFESGDIKKMVRMSGDEFKRLMQDAEVHTISHHL